MSKPHLSADSFAALQHCADVRIHKLREDLWHHALAGGTGDSSYTRNMNAEVKLIEDAKTQLAALFEAQFPPVKPKPETVALGAIHIEAWD